MILSSFGFQRNLDFVLYFCNGIAIFEETNFSILSCLGFIRVFVPLLICPYLFLFGGRKIENCLFSHIFPIIP